jgi:hypothetical protein
MNKNKIVIFGCAILLCGMAVAETQKIDNNSYGVVTIDATEITQPNGHKAMVGGQNHSVIVNSDGETFSQWCQGSAITESDGLVTQAGSCAIIAEDGDVMWVWFRNSGPGSEGTWGVIAGTGEYAGATGGGKTKPGKLLGDGRAFTSTSTGTIKTK